MLARLLRGVMIAFAIEVLNSPNISLPLAKINFEEAKRRESF